ncbi:DUF6624 domain-containing protein [Streptomyces aidingensis]|uniref:Uncharacterized protein n=1 Tax=Streptomyces aidingensis TaxID=910347 RepID=A0A1I1U7S1_9ACTN|nr:DUF6624 domain-containing protein [Streptomyces aidingensis]SFD66827.1 hypothetical protein SAMN05421773_12330 [Streptomyces aidingensis]
MTQWEADGRDGETGRGAAGAGGDGAQPRDPRLAAELLRRMAEDQRLRQIPYDRWTEEIRAELRRIDEENTAWLKGVTQAHGWPGHSLVGREAATAAWLLAQHADHAFQDRARELLTTAVVAGDADPVHLAYLTDRCLTNFGEPQRYGTQYYDPGDGGGIRLYPVADPENLDSRRAALGLGPQAEYDARIRGETG